MRIKLILEYDGGVFSGWQFQPGLITVQGVLEEALVTYCNSLWKKGVGAGSAVAHLETKPSGIGELGPRVIERSSIVVTGSGRTDSGVHARGQVASFDWPQGLEFDAARLLAAINGITPHELVVYSAEAMPDRFSARFSPHIKQYRYYLLLRDFTGGLYQGRSWRVTPQLDIPAMIGAAHLFRGTHNFAAYRASGCLAKTTERTLLVSELSRPQPELLVYTVQGNGFLKQMVRIIVGALVEVGTGKISPQVLISALSSGERSLVTSKTAPASGLEKSWVRYASEST